MVTSVEVFISTNRNRSEEENIANIETRIARKLRGLGRDWEIKTAHTSMGTYRKDLNNVGYDLFATTVVFEKANRETS